MNTRFRVNSLISLALLGYLLLVPLRAATAQDLPDGNQPLAPAAVDAALAAGFKYQGQLQKSGAPYAGRCAMQFRLWTTSTGGTQVGPTLSFSNVNVSTGAFAVTLNFGNGIFTGDARWLATSVQCTGDTAFTELAPRQVISAVPYAIGLRPGAIIRDSSNTGGVALYVEKNVPTKGAGAAVHGKTTSMTNGTGVKGEGLWGVEGIGPNGIGVKGSSTHYYGVYGDTTNGHAGVYGSATATGNGVEGVAGWPGGKGVYGLNHNVNSAGVYGEANATGAAGVYGKGTNNAGVYGLSTSGIGVWGASQQVGVHGEVAGNTAGRVAVRGVDNGADKSTGYAGLFSGNVAVEGTLLPTLAATQIDHPLDPANKSLRHALVQSPDMMSVYNGNVTTDALGDATVTLPAYFEALNQDYRYQLTVIGQFAQAIVAEEILNNQFKIKTDLPNVKVSWQVTGIRHDPYAVANPIVVESNKPAQVLAQSYLPAALAESPAMQSVPAEVLRQPTATQP